MYFSVCFLVQVSVVIIEIDVWDVFFYNICFIFFKIKNYIIQSFLFLS